MKSRIWIVPGLVLLAAVAIWARGEPTMAPRVATAPLRASAPRGADLADREPTVRIIERRVEIPVVVASQRTAPPEGHGEALEEKEGADARQDLAEQQGDAIASRAQLYAGLERRFESQGVDATWRRSTEAQLTDAVKAIEQSASETVRLESAVCRSDICKSTLTHDSERPSPEFMRRLAAKAGVGLENHYEYSDGRTTVYSMRRDDALPQQ